MNDKYPKFLPQWTEAIIHTHSNPFIIDMSCLNEGEINDYLVKSINETHNLRWTSGECCLTGEAFFNEYAPESCVECECFTYDSSLIALRSVKQLYEFKKSLAEHLKKEHTNIWNMWKEKL